MVREYPLQNARVFLLTVVVGSASCSSPTLPLPAAPPPVTPVAAPVTRVYQQISVGQIVTDALTTNGAENSYELTVPRNGTLTVSVSWDRKDGIVELQLGTKRFGFELGNPLIGGLTVIAGQKYLVTIADAAPWDYHGLNLPYTFKSSID